MKMLLLILAILVSLTSCNSPPSVEDQEQCFIELEPVGGYTTADGEVIKQSKTDVLLGFIPQYKDGEYSEEKNESVSYEEQILQLEAKGIDTEASYCGCRQYHYGKDYIGMTKNTTPYKMPLNYCHKTVGWKPDGYSEVVTYWQSMRNWILKYKNYGK